MTDLDQLAERHAVITAPWLVWGVYTGDADLIAEELEPLTRQDLLALAVVLASQVPQPRTRPDDGVVDEVAVERAAAGKVGPLTRAERAAAIRLMAARRVPIRQIQEALHVNHRTVDRVLGRREEGAA